MHGRAATAKRVIAAAGAKRTSFAPPPRRLRWCLGDRGLGSPLGTPLLPHPECRQRGRGAY